MTIHPQGNLLLVKRDKLTESRTETGIVIAQAKGKKSLRGVIEAVGPGAWQLLMSGSTRRPIRMNVGDHVIFSDFNVTDVGNDRILVSEDDILAIITD